MDEFNRAIRNVIDKKATEKSKGSFLKITRNAMRKSQFSKSKTITLPKRMQLDARTTEPQPSYLTLQI